MFSCEFYENLKNTYFEEHLQTTAFAPHIPIYANSQRYQPWSHIS